MRVLAAAIALIATVFLASGCASSGKKATTFPTNSVGGGLNYGKATVDRNHAVRRARASNRRFSIFPMVPGKRPCVIPESAPSNGRYAGICQTSIRRYGLAQMPAVIVTFTESWKNCQLGAECAIEKHLRHHTWQVIEGEPLVKLGAGPPARRVTRSSGATAPQDYR
jgi:hypothetical protein